MVLKSQCNSPISEQIEDMLARVRQRYHKPGEKAGRFLADGIRVERAHAHGSFVMKGDGQVTTEPAVINHQLRNFFQSLDTPEDALHTTDLNAVVSWPVLLSNRSLSERKNELGAHVYASETEDAIKRKCSLPVFLDGFLQA